MVLGPANSEGQCVWACCSERRLFYSDHRQRGKWREGQWHVNFSVAGGSTSARIQKQTQNQTGGKWHTHPPTQPCSLYVQFNTHCSYQHNYSTLSLSIHTKSVAVWAGVRECSEESPRLTSHSSPLIKHKHGYCINIKAFRQSRTQSTACT